MSVPLESNLLPSYLNELVDVKKGFKRDLKAKQILDFVVQDINKNPKKAKLCNNCILRVIGLIENCVEKKDGINKLDLAIDIMKAIFGAYQPVELDSLKSTIQFLLDNKLVKKIKYRKRVCNYFSKVVNSNFFF